MRLSNARRLALGVSLLLLGASLPPARSRLVERLDAIARKLPKELAA